ncbi:sulfite exporter TauE/SafE family protein [Psychroserpens sp.]|uniref:sulfite exporter TauE/SafE family protein n=1 Tax=Psychroserpens sp. TaxID=2020870 RepID=UPI001B1001AB|nr:sulfite exporter TauE/SafE family protein [Psychroserpens sp.]MBO6607012.1 sulfite exporter TauE/SafE family protein [Psychroserpens sp.]MBO6654158.1 sulfite exporter TauE/SafE family protein [Psychroserpens sp.]MBO6682556.1 sulfite exporter TauE/SafE family protein [Psychroserpens sp.]MBO6750784.1 sulfite exporter TauE/SafE family protein [Psychroserpens sp.]MBO6915787.1 sulfite exporter TauE/SafE family protein [Psychroserpens sp.]
MLWSALIFGLLGSFHCVGMCGPIAFMLPVDRNNTSKKILQISTYHIGRILAYSVIGLIFGLVGKGLYIFGIQQQLSIVVGVLMIIIVLIPVNTFNKCNFSKPIYKVISKVKSSLGQALKKKSADTFLTIGFLNGFLPCGLVYMAVIASIAAQNVAHSSLYMALFGLGTIPLMTTAIYLGKFLNTTVKRRIQKAIPVFVIIIGALFIVRGLGLGIPYLSPAPIVEMATSAIDCH